MRTNEGNNQVFGYWVLNELIEHIDKNLSDLADIKANGQLNVKVEPRKNNSSPQAAAKQNFSSLETEQHPQTLATYMDLSEE